ncbi:sulfotransferase domain-containing protein [Guptibacillus algicola]|uniref:sulfotransferase domain-containing protein n=1 Tax=Guptibacillus algicola TaxID=225844 RepID=UPI001CD7B938|nr:sulfotransferase domain-containing protein [Alkalihalobacillus algicola]MCA0987860.1 sulfotransferase domain-containing protein [Alkalihalobacillus algicola]
MITPFFANSIAKSGTHLMKQLLEGHPSLTHHAFIYPGHLDQLQDHKKTLSSLQQNSFANGHIFHSKEYVALFNELQLKQLFLYRDPRDIIVSYCYFFMRFPDHPYRRFFLENNLSIKERCLLFINGVDSETVRRPNIAVWYNKFLGWKNEPNVLPVSYESLVESPESQQQQLERIVNFFQLESNSNLINTRVEQMQANVDPKKSATFRKGQAGNWKQEFDKEVKEAFKAVGGDLLIQLGYEKDNEW